MIDSINELNNIVFKQSAFLNREKGKRDKLKEQLEQNESKINILEEEIELLEKVNVLFKKTSEFAREQAKTQVESLVTKCLEFVFDDDIYFEIDIEELRGRPDAKFYVVTNMEDKEIRLEPENSKGGGVVDVVSLALRVAFLETHRPKILGPLVLDEPAKHVSEEYIYNVSEFLKQNSSLFNRQIIMVTHNDFLAAIGDRSYSVSMEDGISIVSKSEI